MRQRATDKPVRAIGTGVERAFLLVAALCVVMMPSIYRGGAEIPHSHGFFQFWLTGPSRAFDHHRHDHGDGHHGHDAHATHGANDSTSHLSTDSSQVLGSAATDEPRVSPASAPGGAISATAIAELAFVALADVTATRLRFPLSSLSLVGRMLTPEPPPPRQSAIAG